MSENNKKKQETNHDYPNSEQVNKDNEINSTEKDSPHKETKEISIEDKLKETEEKLLRSLAEIENQRRRFEKEIKDAFDFGSFNFAKESLATLDNLQRGKDAIKNDAILKTNKDLDKFLANITIVEKDLVSIFEKNRIIKIDTKDKKFDPNIHQAMSEVEDSSAETGMILQEVQAGYMLGDRLLRPALVVVAKKNNSKGMEIKDKKEEI
jgi:molecular chaperone GrpE